MYVSLRMRRRTNVFVQVDAGDTREVESLTAQLASTGIFAGGETKDRIGGTVQQVVDGGSDVHGAQSSDAKILAVAADLSRCKKFFQSALS